MLAAIDLDDELSPETSEIHYIRSDRNLPLEFVPVESMGAQAVPQPALGIGHV
jgi:hypothetical protein